MQATYPRSLAPAASRHPIAAGLSPAQRRSLTGARRLAWLLDARFQALGVRVGWDGIIGLIPGVGGAFSAVASLYLISVGLHLRLPAWKMAVMLINAGFDILLGMIPIAGAVADILFRSHLRNYRIIENHVRRSAAGL